MRVSVILFMVFAFSCLAFTPAHSAEGISSYKVGDFKVFMLSERQRESDASILLVASEADMEKFIPGGKYPSAVNVFLVETPEGRFLFDTGYGEKLFDHMKELGVTAADVDYLLLTHSHGDHIGGMVKDGVATLPKAEVYVSEKEVEWSQTLRDKLSLYQGRVRQFTPGELSAGG